VPRLAHPQPTAQRFDQPLADGRSDVDQALLNHLHGIEQPMQPLGRHAGGAGADHDPHIAGALVVLVRADRDRDLGLVGRGVMGEVTDQVGQGLAQLPVIDLHELRHRLRDDVELQVLASGFVRQIDGVHQLTHHLSSVHDRKV
jgi:hypothetical protein